MRETVKEGHNRKGIKNTLTKQQYMPITQESITKLAEEVMGTCNSLSEAAEQMKVREDEVEQALEENGVERCEMCNWWCEDNEMQDGKCEDCRESEEDE